MNQKRAHTELEQQTISSEESLSFALLLDLLQDQNWHNRQRAAAAGALTTSSEGFSP